MVDFDKTTRFVRPSIKKGGQVVTIFDAALAPVTYNLDSFGKDCITFAREHSVSGTDGIDIVLTSGLVSRRSHGRFIRRGGKWFIEDMDSANGLIWNNTNIKSREIGDGDFVRIDDGIQTVAAGVLFSFSSESSENKWKSFNISGLNEITIGRSSECTLVLSHVSVSNRHAKIVREGGRFYLYDLGSTNGVILNGRKVFGKVALNEKDIINITNTKIIFTSSMISYCLCKSGITVDASNVVIKRTAGRKSFITCNSVSLSVQPGELVAIIGGSGAGKSTVLNAMCGYLKPTKGNVYINGIDLYQNIDSLKKTIGYVPQADIVYDNISLYDMLKYTAKLRLPKDTSPAEMERAISRAIATVELTEKKNSFIKSLSGGQKKRASIAVELLSDPNLLFLDEPASGLDPGTERNLMTSLRSMADSGKTILLVTHSTLQLKMCDKIVFMGKGGNLCFYGSYDEALAFFGVDDIVDVYRMITDNAPEWREKFAATRENIGNPRAGAKLKEKKAPKYRMNQFRVMSARYAKLIVNEKPKLLIMLLTPLITFALFFAKGTDAERAFEFYAPTNTSLFILSCLCFFIGMSSSIQEVCKEKSILRREYMAGLSLTSYIMSKFAILSVISFIQGIIISAIYIFVNGDYFPEDGLFIAAPIELFITVFLTILGASVTGLFVSTMVKNPDKVAPVFYVIQIVFAGVIFPLSDLATILSYVTLCHWAILAFGNGASICDLPGRIVMSINKAENPSLYDSQVFDAVDYVENWFVSIGIIIASIIIFTALARISLQSVSREKS